MDEYISREALRDVIASTNWYHAARGGKLGLGAPCEEIAVYKATDIYKAVDSVPTADVVEVVRCWECVYGEQYDEEIEDWRECRYDGCGLAYEISHFCSYGKRKDGAE